MYIYIYTYGGEYIYTYGGEYIYERECLWTHDDLPSLC